MKTRLVRNLSIVFWAAVMVMGITSCGKDGKDGKPYIKFDFFGTLLSYSHNLPKVPETIVENIYYETEPGTWTFSYVHANNDDGIWTATITLEKGEDGEAGGLFSDGVDGDNVYYKLTTFAFAGPSLSDYGTSQLKIADVGVCEKKPTQRIVQGDWIMTIDVDCQEISGGWAATQ